MFLLPFPLLCMTISRSKIKIKKTNALVHWQFLSIFQLEKTFLITTEKRRWQKTIVNRSADGSDFQLFIDRSLDSSFNLSNSWHDLRPLHKCTRSFSVQHFCGKCNFNVCQQSAFVWIVYGKLYKTILIKHFLEALLFYFNYAQPTKTLISPINNFVYE